MKIFNLRHIIKFLYILLKEFFIVAAFFLLLACILEELHYGIFSFWINFKVLFAFIFGTGLLTLILSQFVKKFLNS